jgi:conjugative transfer signal peptidase TraF
MKPGASDDTYTHVTRERPAWTTRPGWRTPRARRTAPPGWHTPSHWARRTRSSLVLGGLVLAAVLSTRWVRLNTSPSVPLGLYRLTAIRKPLARGALVVLPAPRAVQAWHSRWVPLLKPVAAVAGDAVCVWDEGLWVAGQWYGPVYEEAQGRPLPHIRGCTRVQDGEVFLASPAPRSLDSRYFSSVPVAALTAQATPLLTWR